MSDNYVDALEDAPDEDFEGDDSTACILGDLRFSARVVSKLRAKGIEPGDVSRIYMSAELEPNNKHPGYSALGRHKGRPVRISIETIVRRRDGEDAAYNVRNAFYID